jgi:hypothetical protein
MSKKYSGIVDLSNEDYHAEREHLSSSNLKMLLKDPADFYEQKILGNKPEPSPRTQANFDEGTYAHSLLLEPHLIDQEFRFYDGWKKIGKAWEDFKEENQGYILLSKPQRVRVERWVSSARKMSLANELLKGGKAEASLFMDYNGIPLKVRADYINVEKGYIVDVKTSGQGSDLESFKITVDGFGYDISSAMYLKLFEKHYGKPFEFYFLVLDKRDNNTEIYKLSADTRSEGDRKFRKALKIYETCKKENKWESTKIIKEEVDKSENYEILEV